MFYNYKLTKIKALHCILSLLGISLIFELCLDNSYKVLIEIIFYEKYLASFKT